MRPRLRQGEKTVETEGGDRSQRQRKGAKREKSRGNGAEKTTKEEEIYMPRTTCSTLD